METATNMNIEEIVQSHHLINDDGLEMNEENLVYLGKKVYCDVASDKLYTRTRNNKYMPVDVIEPQTAKQPKTYYV